MPAGNSAQPPLKKRRLCAKRYGQVYEKITKLKATDKRNKKRKS
jgi:hypothetical protein